MGNADLAKQTIQALNGHAAELDSMYRGGMAAATSRTEIPNIKDIFQEMADASKECDEMLEIYFDDEEPLQDDGVEPSGRHIHADAFPARFTGWSPKI